MSARHNARIIALQTLFELDIKEDFGSSSDTLQPVIDRNRDESFPELKDLVFTNFLVKEVYSRRITIDDIITRAAPDWPIDKIGIIDRNVLRIGLCELLFGDRKDTPPKVAIDEAIELAKEFGGETSGKFVNGVLGAIYKELGEPDKDQVSTKEKKVHPREELAGAVVIGEHEGALSLALVHDVFGYWTLSKGKVEAGETFEDTAKREIGEEIGLTITLGSLLGENEYIANKPDIGKVIKHVRYYVAYAEYKEMTLERKGGLDEAKWFKEDELKGLKIYGDIMPIIEKGIAEAKVYFKH